MLGIIPLYFIGKYFHQLAYTYNRSRWGYAFLGIGIYIVTQVVFAFTFVAFRLFSDDPANARFDLIAGLGGVVTALLSVWVVYNQLKKRWSKNFGKTENPNLLDDTL